MQNKKMEIKRLIRVVNAQKRVIGFLNSFLHYKKTGERKDKIKQDITSLKEKISKKNCKNT
jgi:hypothetical protein